MKRRSGGLGSSLAARLLLPAAFLLWPAGPRAGETFRVPDFRLRTLDGQTLRLEELLRRGPVLLDFWATWCKPCLTSLPELEALHREFGPRGLTVLGLAIDGPRNASRLRPFVTRLRLTYPIGLDEDGALQQAYRVKAVPTAVLLDGTGRIVWSRQGYLPGEGAPLRAVIETLLPAPVGGAAPGRPGDR